jgi:hypothetical protein
MGRQERSEQKGKERFAQDFLWCVDADKPDLFDKEPMEAIGAFAEVETLAT